MTKKRGLLSLQGENIGEHGKSTICRVRKDFHTLAKLKAKKRRMTLQSYLEFLIEKDSIKEQDV